MSIAIQFHDEQSEFMWGCLIATWTKGAPVSELSHIDPEQLKVPVDLADLRRQIELVGIKVTVPDTYTSLTVVNEPTGTLVVRLPEKDELISAEQALMEGALDYSLPRFYATFLGTLDPELPPERRVEFQKFRIGDYAIATCM